MRSRSVSRLTDSTFRRWLEHNPDNERQFERQELLWELLGELGNDPEVLKPIRVSPTLYIRRQNRAHFWKRSRWSVSAALAITVVLGIGYRLIDLANRHRIAPITESLFSTNTGELKRIALQDGSQVVLNTATKLRVRFSGGLRLLSLEQGEATFFVKPDNKRPFEVVAGAVSARAVGTTFDVLYLETQKSVSVLEGKVQVVALSGPPGRRDSPLSSGQATTFTKDEGLGPIVATDVARISSWQARRVEFRDVTLADAVNDFNRYSGTQVVIGDPSLVAIRLSGVFHFGDVAAFTGALQAAFDVRSRSEQGKVVLMAPADGPRLSH